MSGLLINLIIQVISGAIGGNVAAGAAKNVDLGTVLNTVVGAIGGCVAGRQGRKPRFGTLDLVDKALAAGRPVDRRRFPERAVGVAKFGDEIIMPPPGPRAKILLAEIGLLDRVEPKRQRGLTRAARRA